MTKKEALKFLKEKRYLKMTDREIVEFQLYEPLLCMPFYIFHKALEKVLNRPVQTIEFVEPEMLQAEFEKKIQPQNSFNRCIEIISGTVKD